MTKTWVRIYLPKFVHATAMGFVLLLLPVAFKIVQTGRSDTPVQADVAIVLGTGVWRGQPSPVFRERINHAINLYNQGIVDNIIFTGGVGWRDELAEAEVARDYAIARGIPANAIFIETDSQDTYTNLKNAQRIVEQQGFYSVLIISDPFHLHRALIIAQTLGLPAEVSATPTTRYQSPRTQIPFLLAESFTLTRYHLSLFFGLSQGLAAAAL